MQLGSGTPADGRQALAVKTPADAKTANPPTLALSTNPTPPLTPVLADDADASPISFAGLQASRPDLSSALASPSASLADVPAIATPLEFEHDLDIRRDSRGQTVEFGHGAWSVVYSAVCPEAAPASPVGSESPATTNMSDRVFAVKTPLRRDAHHILKAEALLLTRLSRIPGHEDHLVPFHGYVSASHSLVMDALPLTLADYITSQAAATRENFSTSTMFDPVLGMSKWLGLSERLVKGLAWLHDTAQVVHGDIKPQNILLRPHNPAAHEDALPHDLVYVDFTSSHDLSSSTAGSNSHGLGLSALTPPFAAPELLTISALTSSTLAPSKASDTFSLAVTLLTAVTGDLQLYPGAGSMQCLAMSRDGHRVLDFVRSGVNCSRVPRKGTVERLLSPAVLKDPDSRIHPAAWFDLIKSEAKTLLSAASS
ncbi:kinase domain containing protein [Coccidioides posadasii C735 delta SOWgp]|uniref:Kinase domain containing protein n=1 Tax=Coccidioides posadasii (strain C735) TaxID=222929 RepID=C5PB78_COCP7|nr:kinase domain containing protein [Coccidioides posadasii C735 delta SOWgp]EER25862.1 kinase domain containing protein [Coccidioides posadasii C735 delta SOWgp]|eukprot:XP_003068007.1 kinase domain containing protein [Coccidioides posadasii C735 delta SOWgp]